MDSINQHYEINRKFEKEKGTRDRKSKGVFYTPIDIVDHMIQRSMVTLDFIGNPYTRLMDISCGAGNFLIRCFEVLKQYFKEHLPEILLAHPDLKDKLSEGSIGKFIVEHNLWGVDIDEAAVQLLRQSLAQAAGCSCNSNIYCEDSLLSDNDLFSTQYDLIIGNPPYLGHKAVNTQYKSVLYERYNDVYRDKADISYCFFKRAMELLKPGGSLNFITSRYFMEGPSAANLRGYLTAYDIEEIVDFGDSRVFADAGVAVCIIRIRKQPNRHQLKIIKLDDYEKKTYLPADITQAPYFLVKDSSLKQEGWMFLREEEQAVFELIEQLTTHSVGEIFDSYQGIITGCDKAFVLDAELAEDLRIEPELLKPWVKNSQLEKNYIQETNKRLIYANFIEDISKYPNAIRYIEKYKEKLLQRRECQKGIRPWYQLQWGRSSQCFESEKIIYPYKAGENRFAVDNKGLYCSADVYSLILKEAYTDSYSLEYLSAILNTKLSEFYFKCFAKKISPTLYDYYPNKVSKIRLKLDEQSEVVGQLVKQLQGCQNPVEKQCILQAIDRETYRMYGLKENQIKIIEG